MTFGRLMFSFVFAVCFFAVAVTSEQANPTGIDEEFTINWRRTEKDITHTVTGPFRNFSEVLKVRNDLYQAGTSWCPFAVELERHKDIAYRKYWSDDDRAVFARMYNDEDCGYALTNNYYIMDPAKKDESKKEETDDENTLSFQWWHILVAVAAFAVIAVCIIGLSIVICKMSKKESGRKSEVESSRSSRTGSSSKSGSERSV